MKYKAYNQKEISETKNWLFEKIFKYCLLD